MILVVLNDQSEMVLRLTNMWLIIEFLQEGLRLWTNMHF